jgi:putative flippase GtrA
VIARLARNGERQLRFALAGAANTVFGLAIYPILLWSVPSFQTHYLLALGIAQAVSLCFAFLTYKLGVFRTRGHVVGEFFRFSSFYLLNYAANWLALPLLVEAGRVPPIIAQSGFTVIVIVGSYFWHSRLSFRQMED